MMAGEEVDGLTVAGADVAAAPVRLGRDRAGTVVVFAAQETEEVEGLVEDGDEVGPVN